MPSCHTLILPALLALASADPPDFCNRDEAGYCTDPVVKISLRAGEANPRIRLDCALGDVLVVQLPEGDSVRGEPAVGNAALFQFKLQPEPLLLYLWPTIPKGSDVTSLDLAGETSNLQVNLSSGINLIFELRIAAQGVQRVVLRNPVLEKEQLLRKELEEKIRREVESDLARRRSQLDTEVRDRALAMVSRGLLTRIHCTDLRDRAMQDLLVVRAHRICHLGDHVYLELSIHNRARDLFALGKLEVLATGKEGLGPLDSKVVWESDRAPQLTFDQKIRAVAAFPVSEESASAEYGLRISESAGRKRVVHLEGIEF